MSKFYSFDEEAIQAALDAAKKNHESSNLMSVNSQFDTSKGGDLQISAQCVKVTVENNKVCVELPLNLGKHCLTIPLSIPNGSVGQACLSICTTWGIPTGVRVSVIIAGITVISQVFGKC